MTVLRNSPLHQIHEELGASFTPFGAWNMPLKYQNELEEHRAVRQRVGLFDLSHMGEIRVKGADSADFLDYALISTISATSVGQAKYTMIIAKDGGIIDDLIVYRLGSEEFLLVPNASNIDPVHEALEERVQGFDNTTLIDESPDTALIAIQGPRAEEVMVELVGADHASTARGLKYYRCAKINVDDAALLVARTGYTGEDGFELFVDADQAIATWRAVARVAEPFEATVCGLAARDSLRLEAAMPLYGHELSRSITPIEAGMERAYASKTVEFVGKKALETHTATRTLVALTSSQRRAAREGSEVFAGETCVGVVTSGQPSPTLGHPIALALIDTEHSSLGTDLNVDVRGKRYPFTVSERPFYKRTRE